MAGFIEGILQKGGLLFFISLQIFCGVLVAKYNDEQAKVANASWQFWSASVVNFTDGIRDYITLRAQINALKEENAVLREQVSSSLYLIEDNVDSTYNERTLQRFTYVTADIINKTPPGNNNFFLLDKGTRDTVSQGMGVIGTSGIIGVIVGVSDRFARVMTILHRQSKVSAGIRGKPFFGTLIWRSEEPQKMLLDAVPKHATVAVNDTVITSGYSNLYPADIALGIITNHKVKPGDSNLTLEVELFDNIFEAEHAYIVRDLLKDQIDKTQE